jgi:hypothetical protein
MTKRAITETTSGTPAITYRIFRRKVHADQHAAERRPPEGPEPADAKRITETQRAHVVG